MRVTLPSASAVRRLRPSRRNDLPVDEPAVPVTSIDSARESALADFEREVHAIRETIFRLADAAHGCIPHEYTELHVSLQIVSNELGQIERIIDGVRGTGSGPVARVS